MNAATRPGYKAFKRRKYIENKKFWEEIIVYFPSIRHE
jgi:hypothetical protein